MQQRFLAEVVRLAPDADELHMQAWIDERMWYDTLAFPDQDTLRFVYYFQQGTQPLVVRF